MRPLRGLDKNGAPFLDSRFNELQVYGTEGIENSAVLGKIFLSQASPELPRCQNKSLG